MEKAIKRQRPPNTDSIAELARFWDAHDLTDFEDDLEEADEPVFVRTKGRSLSINLQPAEVEHLKRIARSKGVNETTIVRQWVLERLHRASRGGRMLDEEVKPPARKVRRG